MDPITRLNPPPSAVERIMRKLGLLPPAPKVVIARVRPRPAPWPPRR